MPTTRKNRPAWPLNLAALLLISACATPSETMPPVVVNGPALTPLPAELKEIEPPPSGYYSKMLSDFQEGLRKRLTSTPAK